jgi:hypothetical protein
VKVHVSGVGFALAAALSAAATAAAASPPVGPVPVSPVTTPNNLPTTATLSSTRAGAKPVELTLKVRYEMVCGQPGTGQAIVTLPAEAIVPGRIVPSAVLVDGKIAPSVSVSGHDVSIGMPPRPHGVSCLVVGPGTLTLTLTRAAGIGNPKAAGTYTIRVRRNTKEFRARVNVSA